MANTNAITPIHQDANIILKQIFKTITERCTLDPSIPLKDPDARVEYYTGLTHAWINKFLDSEKKTILDIQSRILILNAVKSIYAQDELPTYNVIYEEIYDKIKTIDGNAIGLDVFVDEMKKLSYTWKETVQCKKFIMEDPELRFQRFHYLNKLKKFRNSAQWQIAYIDERFIDDSGNKFEKPSLKMSIPNILEEQNECVFYHAVTKNGLVTGMYSNQASETDFTKWLIDVLLIQFKCPTVIIMDSNPMHGSLENVSSITGYHSKMDMHQWLTNNNIPCSINMSKPALFKLIKMCNENHMEYKIDRIIRSQGHEVLRVPCNFEDLIMTTPLWEHIVKNKIKESNSLMRVQDTLMKRINEISETQWSEFEATVQQQENKILQIDMVLENFSDKYEIKLDC